VSAAVVEDLEAGPEWRGALGTLSGMLGDGTGGDRLEDLVATLARRGDGPELDAGAQRDQPSRQRLVAVVDQVTQLPTRQRSLLRARLLAVADFLETARPLGPEEWTLRFAALDWARSGPVLASIARRLDEHPLLAHPAMVDLARALARDQERWTGPDLGAAADDLVSPNSLGAGALALQLVGAAGVRYGWPQEWRDRLRALRHHASGDVATLARAVATAPE
jgi:hypothetical protein